MKDKTYVNKCKLVEKVFDNGGALINAAFNVDELVEHADDNGWVNLVIAKRREPSDKGATHYAYFSDYKPENKPEKKPEYITAKEPDGLPF
jgi:hypothetical protein